MKKIGLIVLLILLISVFVACSDSGSGSAETSGESSVTSETKSETGADGHTHEYKDVIYEPSCTAGYTRHTCSVCGHTYDDSFTDAKGHQFTDAKKDNTCDKQQVIRHTCSVCGYTYDENTGEQGTIHSMKFVELVNPTETQGGYKLYKCERCGIEEKSDLTTPADFSVGLEYKKQYGNVYYVSGLGSCTDTDIVIPDVNEYGQPVTGITNYAFRTNCGHIKSITFPDDKNFTISDSSLYGCQNIEELTVGALNSKLFELFNSSDIDEKVPRSLKKLTITASIGEYANLSKAPGLETVVTSDKITTIPKNFFSACKSLKNVELSDKVSSIGNYAFRESSIESFKVPKSLTELSVGIFQMCDNLRSVELHDNFKVIGTVAFGQCRALENIELPASLTTIDGDAFTECTKLKSITIPTSVTQIGDQAFCDCSSLETVKLHDGITSIGYRCFEGTAIKEFIYPKNLVCMSSILAYCKKLEYVEMNDKCTVIPKFTYCSSLKKIVIPDGPTTMESYAFTSCLALEEITLPSTLTALSDSAFANCQSLKSINIPSKITVIPRDAFRDCASLGSIELHDGITSIGYDAFSGCSSLDIKKLPKALTSIGQRAFYNSGIVSLNWSGTNTVNIAKEAFAQSKKLESVTLSTFTNLGGEGIFENCTGILTVTVGEGITEIPKETFCGCSALEILELPLSLRTIKEYAFYDCSSLTSLVIGKNVSSVEAGAFSRCTSLTHLEYNATNCTIKHNFAYLTSVSIGEGVKIIPTKFFMNSKLTEVTLPESMEIISEGAFSGCTLLEKINFPENLYSIENGAFDNTALESIIFESDRLALDVGVFERCTALKEVDFGGARVTLGGETFAGCDALESVKNSELVSIEDSTDFPSRFIRTENSLIICLNNVVGFEDSTIGFDVVIPEGIKFIANKAFSDCDIMRTLKLPSTLLTIGSKSFKNCTRLTKLELPSGLEGFGEGAFSGCTGLAEAVIPDSVNTVPSAAFAGCTALEKLYIGSGVKEIADDFIGQDITKLSLYDVTYNGTVDDFGKIALGKDNALSKCTVKCNDGDIISVVYTTSSANVKAEIDSSGTLTISGEGTFKLDYTYVNDEYFDNVRKIVICDGITSVTYNGQGAYSKLSEIVIPKSLVSFNIDRLSNTPWYQNNEPFKNGLYIVGNRLYDASPDLEGEVVIPDGIISIGANAFTNCNKVTEVYVPGSVTVIDSNAFYNCASLEKLTISEGLEKLGVNVIMSCPSLTELTLPSTLKSAVSIVSDCKNLKKLTLLSAPSKISTIASYCDNLETIIIGEGLTTLTDGCIYSCENLKTVVLPKTLTTVERLGISGRGKSVNVMISSPDKAQSIIDQFTSWVDIYTFYVYSATTPTQAGQNFWHYNDNGEPVIW